MLNLKDLWIGDSVRVISNNKLGTFQGISDTGLALVKIDSGLFRLRPADIALHVEAKKQNLWVDEESTPPVTISNEGFKNELDLHIEKLDPALLKAMPQVILNQQITAAKNYVEKAIKNYRSTVKIIHGKGTGQLKAEVYHILKSYKEVYHSIPANDGGAVEVLFRY